MPSYMREVKIPGKNADELFQLAKQGLDHMLSRATIGNFDVKHDVNLKEIRVKGSMLSATLSCSDEKMKIEAQLSLLATPFKAKIDEGITRWLAKTFKAKDSA